MKTPKDNKELYIMVHGRWRAFKELPCSKCKDRYSLHCPKCEWNKYGNTNTYGGRLMTAEEAEKLNEELRNNDWQ